MPLADSTQLYQSISLSISMFTSAASKSTPAKTSTDGSASAHSQWSTPLPRDQGVGSSEIAGYEDGSAVWLIVESLGGLVVVADGKFGEVWPWGFRFVWTS